MKKYFKKISALLMAAIMVLSMCTSVFAAETSELPKATDVAEEGITVNGLHKGDKVEIAKIVRADYNDYGFTGYVALEFTDANNDVVKVSDVYNPSTAEIAALIKLADFTEYTAKISDETGTVKFKGLTAGMYLIKVTAAEGSITVYNPMIASVYYTDAHNNVLTPGSVNAGTDSFWELKGVKAYAKSTKDFTPDKVIVKGDTTGKNDDVKAGSDVKFRISGTIPSYSRDYFENPTYVLTDKLSKGLKLTETADSLKTIVEDALPALPEETSLPEGTEKANVAITEDGDNTVITITLTPAYIYAIANVENRSFSFDYTATVNGEEFNFDASTNSVQLNYTRTPGVNEKADPKETYHYTFNLENEIKKVGDDKVTALPGAEFQLFTDKECTKPAYKADGKTEITSTSDADGKIKFEGLEDGTYYLKETKAPTVGSTHYQLTNKVYEIVITPKYSSDDNKMSSYTVKVTDIEAYNAAKTDKEKENAIKTTTYTVDTKGNLNTNLDVTNIVNTTMGTLPSTGGMGTYIFTIVGVVLMACAAGAFFMSRRKTEE